MKNISKSLRLLILLPILFADSGIGQVEYPRISPGAKVSQMIGITEVTVSYHRPGVKGRLVDWYGEI